MWLAGSASMDGFVSRATIRREIKNTKSDI